MNKGTRISFNSQFQKANGTWEVYNTMGDNVLMARVLKNGTLSTPNAKNLLVVDMPTLNIAFFVGTAKMA